MFFVGYDVAAQMNNSLSANTSNHKQIYIYLGDIGFKSQNLVNEYNIKPIFLIGGYAIDPVDNGCIDTQSLRKNIEKVIPDPNATGIAILDWEGKAMHLLSTVPVKDLRFNEIIEEYIKMIEMAKALRPQIKWGIYALPFRSYWNRNEDWRNRSFLLKSLLSHCDVITPSVYNLYTNLKYKYTNKLYLLDNVSLALNIGNMLNKPVLPFVTHRWPNLKIIPKEEFADYIDKLFKIQYSGKHIDGIIWWGPDEYYYKTGNQELKREFKSDSSFSEQYQKLIYEYLSSITQLSSFRN
jgi:hypothetical protein